MKHKIPIQVGRKHLPALGFMALSLCGLAAQAASSSKSADQTPPTPEQLTFFETKVRPVLAENCLPCHGDKLQSAGLRLDSLAAALKGGDSGPSLVAGDPDKSLLISAIRQTGSIKMPKGGKLKPSEIADLETWVKMGAPWPATADSKKVEVESLWSLQPVQKPAIPKTKLTGWVKNGIDAFVLSGLETKQLKPNPPADRRTLLRRVTYDLTGLPPTAPETDDFIADKSPTAYDKVVDRLLNSPRYGERWGRHWLDVARYADTKGYVFNEDRNYPNAYTYRNWVIEALNRDLPYNQFVIEQLAADRLPEVKNGQNKEPLAALGFLTVGRRFLNDTPDIIDDRIDVTMRGFEGFTVACARCHDHKFDPIPTQDYYSLYAVFASSVESNEPISIPSIRDPWQAYNRDFTSKTGQIHDLVVAQVKALREKLKVPAQAATLGDNVKRVLSSVREEEVPEGEQLNMVSQGFEPAQQTRLKDLQTEVAELDKHKPPTPEFAMAMEDGPKPSDGVVFKRGNRNAPGPVAPRRFLLALSKPGQEREHWTSDSGRLELANAIASRQNPLTARVFVNRAWQYHFGAGIVRTPSDFGHQGEKPTDPKLLDYLASTFMGNGWSMKKLHRMIVTSSTYRQSSEVTPAALNADPDNRLWGRMNRQRLDLEEMRDSYVAAAGKLDIGQVGGPSVDLWSRPFTDRRAVYGFIERQNLPGTFRTFDFATPDSTNPKRFQTTVPQQALFFMNSPFSVEQAQAVVSRPEITLSKDDPQRIRRLYRVLFDRLPDADETAIGLSYLKPGSLASVSAPPPSWQYGYGGYDETQKRVTTFTPLADFSDAGYHVGKQFPDPVLGYITLNGNGGHPGHDAQHAVIRRWIASANMTVKIRGRLTHGQKDGDGVRARIVSSRNGLLGEWQAHDSKVKTELDSVVVQKGDILDFVVDPKTSDGFDSFGWAPVVQKEDGTQEWSASAEFGAPPAPPLSRIALYAQALMMTNEFMFID